MALPHPNDPARPIVLAVRSMRLLGCVLFLMCTCGGSLLMRAFNGEVSAPLAVGAVVVLYAYAVAIVLLSYFVRRLHRGSIIASLCLTLAATLVAASGTIRFAIY